MKDKKTKLFINIFLTAILSVLMCLTFIGCQDQQDTASVSSTVAPSDSAYHQTEGAEAINKLIAALPDEKAFGAENVAALESIIGKYELLSDTEKTKVEYGKVEKLLSATVYLDEQTLEYIPESSNTFSLKPYLRGKNITRVTLGENRLLAGQYSVDGNNLIISDKRLKELIPSVTEIRISTDVSDDFVYTVYVGMDGDEAIFLNAENTESINKTSLKKISGGKLDFAVTKENGFAYAVCFSDNSDFVGFDFKNKRTYKLFFEFTVPSGPDAVGIPVYFEGVGGKLCTISFLDGEPIISDAAASTDKSVSISYLGSGVYGFYGSFFAEEGMKTLVIGVEGGATTVEMDNFCLYPACGAPGFYSDDFGYDISEGGTLDIPVYLNAEKLDKVTINGKEVAYLMADGVLRIAENALSGLKENEENILTIDNGYGSVSAKVTAFNGLPVMTSESVARYFTDGETPIFTFDLKGKTLKDITLNGKTVEKSSYSFNGEALTFSASYLNTLYGDSVFEAHFIGSNAAIKFSIETSYVYSSNFRKGASDSDLEFAPDGTGKVVYENGIFWANYVNKVGGTQFILHTNTFSLVNEKQYLLSYKLKFGAGQKSGWWGPVWLKGGYDLIYMKTSSAGVLTTDGVYPASNPLDTNYSYTYNGSYYEINIEFTARSKGISALTGIEFASWDASADLYIADLTIAESPLKTDVLMIGSDLLSEGYWGTYKTDVKSYQIVNLCKIGSNIDYWQNAVESLSYEYSPKKILLSVGENDIYSGGSANAVAESAKALISKIKSVFPRAKLYFVSPIKTVKNSTKNATVVQFNDTMKAFAVDGGYRFVDVTKGIENDNGSPETSFYLNDGLHIRRSDYDKISAEIINECALDGALDALFIGDSYMSTAYWTGYSSDMSDIVSVNVGVSGTTTGYWQDRVGTLAEKYAAHAIVVHIGVNDIDDQGADSSLTARRIKTLVNALHEAFPKAEILWLTISPNNMFASKNYLYPPVNEEMKGFAADNQWFKVIDVAKYFTGADGKYLSQYYLSEGMHLNASGYEIFVREIRRALGI